MSPNADLTPPGSSTYSSNTLHVGDGTWDQGRDTFLLPNLMGVNFEMMRYNGMGNRFKEMAGYHSIIIAHGVIGTIVFLGLVPLSTFLIRYYSRWNPFWAFKLHAWCQVLTLLLTTVVFVLGWFAVGPQRSLTNPHHGIGLAIYVMVIFQILWGWFVHKVESKRQRHHVPLKLVIHRWLGRALTILGIVQIPLGLTLYGSPKSLFILFALAAFALLLVYFVMSYLYDTEGYHMGSEYDARHSHYTGPSEVEEHRPNRLGQALAGGALGAGLLSMFRRRPRSRTTSQAYEDSRTSFSDEKYSDESSRHGGWGKKLLEVGALAGAGLLAKKWWDRRRNRQDDAESGRYRPAHSRSDSYTEDSLSRLEDGRPEPSHRTPLNRPPSRPPSRPQSPGSSYYYNSTYYTEPEGGRSHTARNAFLGAGALAAMKKFFGRGKDDDKRRLEDIRRREEEDERIQRANSKRRPHAGEGPYPHRRRPASYSDTELTETDLTRPPRQASHGESLLSAEPIASGAVHAAPSDIPPAPPAHQELLGDLRPSRRHSYDGSDFASGTAAGAAGAAAASGHRHRSSSRHRSNSRRREDHVESPPVSVKVKMHNDGRHVTLRRLTEEEAAANREARRRERRSSRRRAGSASSLSGNEGSNDRWRRVEEMERRQAEQMQREQEAAAAATAAAGGGPSVAPSGSVPPSSFVPHSQVSHMPPPPPVPHPAPSSMPYGPGSVTSPGTWTGTEASGSYANNRRRRRAERARARQDRQQPHGVEFT
ncbi:hypothetical protein NUU61_001202 [Penicillium alfredii]|uniref:Cytochrome b561 domain-containing protein n=1 Tax=Penicillium alfredii TaxID=1506179 RepID=A0A9W9GBK1_9EURO|nr:uncharacterized protein NUU61_001202 [Penicillium alfredii]KAJ5115443.1 hypothetical protein NUU61_001202 [Penicillium alfredii]